MSAAIALPLTEKMALRAREVHAAWTADPEMPETAGCLGDAVKAMAVRAAVYEATGEAMTAALPAPVAVELSALLLAARFPELSRIEERTGHPFITGDGGPWEPDGYLHQVYVEAFGPVAGRHWPV